MNKVYRAGQIWAYKTREGEDESAVLILKVETYNNQEIIIHIAISNVKISNSTKEVVASYISHLPFTDEAIDKSTTNLISENIEVPDFSEEYNQWKEAFEQGRAGVFSIDISEAIVVMEKAIQE